MFMTLSNVPGGSSPTLTEVNLDEYANAHVLIIGDRMGKYLETYKKQITDALSVNTQQPISVKIMAQDHYGLHRSIQLIKQLKKIPPLIIYHGASEEEYERKFFATEIPLILKNFELYRNSKVRTLLQFAPKVSKFIYKNVNRVKFKSILREDKTPYNAQQRLQEMELGYLLYESELEELAQEILSKNRHLIFINTPINFAVLPKRVCEYSTSNNIMAAQNQIFTIIQKGDYKDAFVRLKELNNLAPGNALTLGLLGQSAEHLGETGSATQYYEQANSLDCQSWRSTPVHNAIMQKISDKYNLGLLDFYNIVARDLGQNILFVDELHPQVIYYQKMVEELIKQIKKFLEL
ncbi:MAG: hypothetical protein HQK53_15710 [Oligoflexia bacterium]|nr:hypothetical protein [Oligoflexia bacterium]